MYFFALIIFQYFNFLTNIVIFHFLECFEYCYFFDRFLKKIHSCMMAKIIHKDEKIT
jgi:hypothetical protein